MTKLKILVIGSGAREHAIVWKLAQSSKVKEIFVAPGNAGTQDIATNLDIALDDVPGLAKAAQEHRVDMTFVGPEIPLAEGVVDYFESRSLPIFGPSKAAAQIEASKAFAKDLMQKYGIPCARSVTFTSLKEALAYLKDQKAPIVIKADGLAAGKGVTVANTLQEAADALLEIMEKKAFGDSGNQVVIEDCLFGNEMSAFAFSDGETMVPMVSACDYKTVFDGGRGPNTGGMGSYSPPFFLNQPLSNKIRRTIMKATMEAMRKEGRPYKGVLFGGLMITEDGPKVIEFNARLGDPETQVIMPRLRSDLMEIVQAVIEKRLNHISVSWKQEACVGVVMASGGYPGKYQTGLPISGLDMVDKDILIFHAGTKRGTKGQVVTNGGRVLTVVARGKTIAEAREKVYNNLPRIHFEGCHYRRDIALI